MEESKEVKMTPTKGGKGNAQPEKMSYEQMVNIANQLQGQNRELTMRLNNLANVYHRLDYLFKVLENAAQFKKEFVEKCATEIQDIITIPEEEESKPEESKKD